MGGAIPNNYIQKKAKHDSKQIETMKRAEESRKCMAVRNSEQSKMHGMAD